MTEPENAGQRWAMVLAAGKGTRLKSFTEHTPKALVRVAGKPLIEWVLQNLSQNGFTHVVVNVHHFADQITDFLQAYPCTMQLMISDERQQLMDTGGAILKALPLFPNNLPVMIHNVDILHQFDLQSMYDQFFQGDASAALVTNQRNSSRKFIFNGQHELIGWENASTGMVKWVRNSPDAPPLKRAFCGIHFINPASFQSFETKPCSIIDLYLQLASNQVIKSHEADNLWWFDVGKAEEINTIEQFLYNLQP